MLARPHPRPLRTLAAAAAVAALLLSATAAANPARVSQAPGDARPAPLRLSLSDCLDLAMRRSPALARAELLTEAAAGDADAIGARPWQVALSARRTHTESATLTTDRDRIDASLAHRFATGTTVTAAYTEAGPLDGIARRATPDELGFSTLSLSLIQPLLRGARPSAVDGEQRAAAHAATAAAARERDTRAAVIAATTAGYWELALAHADVALRQRSLDAARRQVRLTESLMRGGQVPRSASIAAERAVAERSEALITAELAVTERSLVLAALLGIGTPAPIVPIDAIPEPRTTTPPATTDATTPLVAAAVAEVDAAAARRRAADDATLPALDAELATATTWTDDADPALVATASLTLRHDLGGSQGGVARRARADERRARLELADARRALRLDVAAATARVDAATRRAALTRDIAAQAETLAAAEVTRFSAGQATVFDVLARQAELEEAERRALRAAVDRAVACADLCRLTGCPEEFR
jgi:outer membrane protein TolC